MDFYKNTWVIVDENNDVAWNSIKSYTVIFNDPETSLLYYKEKYPDKKWKIVSHTKELEAQLKSRRKEQSHD